MEIVNIHEAKTHLSRLVDKAAKGQAFIIAKAGKPMVKVIAIKEEKFRVKFGALEGLFAVPEDIKEFGRAEIEEMFYGKE